MTLNKYNKIISMLVTHNWVPCNNPKQKYVPTFNFKCKNCNIIFDVPILTYHDILNDNKAEIFLSSNTENLKLLSLSCSEQQIKNIIERCLMKESIIADNIEIVNKKFKNIDFFKSAQDILDEVI